MLFYAKIAYPKEKCVIGSVSQGAFPSKMPYQSDCLKYFHRVIPPLGDKRQVLSYNKTIALSSCNTILPQVSSGK